MTAPQPGEIEVEDQLERRIRKPVDLLRCALSCFGIVALAVAGVVASATTSGVETDIADASRRLPHALVVVVSPVALFGLLVLPVAMAVQLLVRRQFRRLAEAVATGVLAAAVTAVASDLLTAARRQPALLCDHHGPPGHQPRRGARPLPGGPGRLRHHGRPGRPAVLAERPVGGDRRVRDRAGGSVAHLRAEPADHGARGPRDRPRRQVRRGLRVAAARRSRDRRRAGRHRPAGDRDTAGPPPGTPPGKPLTPLRGHSQGRRRQAGCRRVRPGPAGSRRLLPAVPEGAGARAGVTHRAAVGGPRGRAPGPAVLRGRGGGRAHAAAARRGPGRSRSRRAGL